MCERGAWGREGCGLTGLTSAVTAVDHVQTFPALPRTELHMLFFLVFFLSLFSDRFRRTPF